jgi:hypothetical protein
VRKLTGLHLALNPHLTEGPKGEGRGEKLGRSLASPKTMQQNAARPDFDPAGSDVQCQVCDGCGMTIAGCVGDCVLAMGCRRIVISRRSRASLLGIEYCITVVQRACVYVLFFYSRPFCWG